MKPAPAAGAKGSTCALAGTFAELAEASDAGVQVARAVFPLHAVDDPFPSDEERDALWWMFEVPVLAMLVDDGGSVIGYECEMQDGFHLREDCDERLLAGRVESSLCECGRPGRRLVACEEEVMLESQSSAAD